MKKSGNPGRPGMNPLGKTADYSFVQSVQHVHESTEYDQDIPKQFNIINTNNIGQST